MKSNNLPATLEILTSTIAICVAIFIASFAYGKTDATIKFIIYAVSASLIAFSIFSISDIIKNNNDAKTDAKNKAEVFQASALINNIATQEEIEIQERYKQQIDRSKIIIDFLKHQDSQRTIIEQREKTENETRKILEIQSKAVEVIKMLNSITASEHFVRTGKLRLDSSENTDTIPVDLKENAEKEKPSSISSKSKKN